jgi:SAM-dependent methyltransferase
MVEVSEVKKFFDARPCNIRHGTAAVGTVEWSEQVTARKYFVEPHIKRFAQFERCRGARVLEIGCGIGTDTIEFIKAGAIVDAVDVSRESVELAWKRSCYLRGSVNFHIMDAEKELPSPRGGEQYDLIYSFGVLHHTPHPERVLALAYERMKSGGELRVMLYAKRSIKRYLGQQPEAQGGCPLARRYSKREALSLFTSEGFHVESITQAHIFPYRVKDYVQHRYIKRWLYRHMPSRMFRWMESVMGDHLLIVARKSQNEERIERIGDSTCFA